MNKEPCNTVVAAMRTIFRNAQVFSAVLPQSDATRTNCFVVNESLIEYVGAEDDEFVKRARAQNYEIQDVQGRTIAPGFIDG